MHLYLSISPIVQVKKPRRRPLRLRFLLTPSKKYPAQSTQVIYRQFLSYIVLRQISGTAEMKDNCHADLHKMGGLKNDYFQVNHVDYYI